MINDHEDSKDNPRTLRSSTHSPVSLSESSGYSTGTFCHWSLSVSSGRETTRPTLACFNCPTHPANIYRVRLNDLLLNGRSIAWVLGILSIESQANHNRTILLRPSSWSLVIRSLLRWLVLGVWHFTTPVAAAAATWIPRGGLSTCRVVILVGGHLHSSSEHLSSI